MEQIQLYAILYCPSQRKQHVYGNLSSFKLHPQLPVCFGFTIFEKTAT